MTEFEKSLGIFKILFVKTKNFKERELKELNLAIL